MFQRNKRGLERYKMAVLTALALVGGLALAGAGIGAQIAGAKQSNDAQKQEIAAQQQSEAIRQQGMNLDAQRKRREQVRQGMLAQSQALTAGANSGAQYSSGVAGAVAGAGEQAQYNVLGTNEAQGIGNQLFQSNRNIFAAKSRQADAASLSATGSGLSSLGGALLGNIGSINRIGGAFSGKVNNG